MISSLIIFASTLSLLIGNTTTNSPVTGEHTTVGNIVLAGMLIVFVSLIVVAVVISFFKHLSKNKLELKKDENRTMSKRISSVVPLTEKSPVQPLDQRLLTAIITMIFLHENEVENQSKMLLTMKRAKMSQWKQASKNRMPNDSFGNVPVLRTSKPVE